MGCPPEVLIGFDAIGGSLPDESYLFSGMMYAKYDSAYGQLPVPTKAGYTFDGWYTSESGGEKITSNSIVKVTKGYQLLYAHWNAESYKVTFDANGGKVSTSTKNVIFGNTYGTLPTPTRTGYTFDGWYTSATGGTKLTDSSNVDVTTPTRTGYTFDGWYTSATGGTKITDFSNVNITSNQMLYAHWSLNIGDITADGKISVADVIALQRWIHKSSDKTLSNWKNADLNNDGKVNVIDLALLKKISYK